VFAPFFGRQALTLTLIPKLAERSGAPVLFAWAEPVRGRLRHLLRGRAAAIADARLRVAPPGDERGGRSHRAPAHGVVPMDLQAFQQASEGSGEKNPYLPGLLLK
jgi:KDO2-lipid IV(A) lauroyltransferase